MLVHSFLQSEAGYLVAIQPEAWNLIALRELLIAQGNHTYGVVKTWGPIQYKDAFLPV